MQCGDGVQRQRERTKRYRSSSGKGHKGRNHSISLLPSRLRDLWAVDTGDTVGIPLRDSWYTPTDMQKNSHASATVHSLNKLS